MGSRSKPGAEPTLHHPPGLPQDPCSLDPEPSDSPGTSPEGGLHGPSPWGSGCRPGKASAASNSSAVTNFHKLSNLKTRHLSSLESEVWHRSSGRKSRCRQAAFLLEVLGENSLAFSSFGRLPPTPSLLGSRPPYSTSLLPPFCTFKDSRDHLWPTQDPLI